MKSGLLKCPGSYREKEIKLDENARYVKEPSMHTLQNVLFTKGSSDK